MKKQLIVYSLLALLVGCSQPKGGDGAVVIPFELKDAKLTEELLDKVEYLALDTPDEFIVADVAHVVQVGDILLVQDAKWPKSVKAFDRNGKFLHQYGREGKGRGEYIALSGVAYDADHLYAFDGGQRKLMTFDLHTGAYLSTAPMEYAVEDMVKLDNGDFLLFTPVMHPMEIQNMLEERQPYRLTLLDSELNFKEFLMPYEEGECTACSQSKAFTLRNDTIVLQCYYDNSIYLLDKKDGALLGEYFFDFGMNAKPFGEYNANLIGDCSTLYPPFYLHNNKLFGGALVAHYLVPFAVDCQTGGFYLNPSGEDMMEKRHSAWGYMAPICGIVGDAMVSSLDSPDTYKMLMQFGFQEAPAEVVQHLEDNKTVLVFYRLK